MPLQRKVKRTPREVALCGSGPLETQCVSPQHHAPTEPGKTSEIISPPGGRTRSTSWGPVSRTVLSTEPPQGPAHQLDPIASPARSGSTSSKPDLSGSGNSSISTTLASSTLASSPPLSTPCSLSPDIQGLPPARAHRARSCSDPGTPVAGTPSSALQSDHAVSLSASKAGQTRPPQTEDDSVALPSTTPACTQHPSALQARGRRLMFRQKLAMICLLIGLNFVFIFATWWWPGYYYVYLPFITLPLALNCCMIASIIVFSVRNVVRPEKKILPDKLENMVLLMPCYNETYEECTKSLNSLVSQTGIDGHKKAILIICDGRVRGPGMDKTTGQYLNDDILVDRHQRETIRGAYTAWDGKPMDVEVTSGTYKGVPYLCIVKHQNQGKRDSLIVVRSFLYNFNIRKSRPRVIFSPRLFKTLSSWLTEHVGMEHVDFLVGMDADTVFDPACISELVKESRYPDTVGVCGYVAVDFKAASFNLWSLYQSAEYTIAQGLRRLHQSIATHKVSCLPGCCQLLRVCETTCGDLILLDKFGYHPEPLDGIIKQIRATASEDRNHVCLMLTTFPQARTRQALRARAYTDVPHSWSVFLSQRRRWTLGATANDLLLTTARGTQWWERIVAVANVITWCLNVFVIASIACMVLAFLHQPFWIILSFAGVMIIPLLYYIGIVAWIPHSNLGRIQYLLGLFLFVVCGPVINIAVLIFALWNMDSFGWGKTRKVVAEDSNSSSDSEERATDLPGSMDEDEKWVPEKRANDEESQLGPLGKPPRTMFTCPG